MNLSGTGLLFDGRFFFFLITVSIVTNHILKHMYGIYKTGIDEPICREGIEMQM